MKKNEKVPVNLDNLHNLIKNIPISSFKTKSHQELKEKIKLSKSLIKDIDSKENR
ncbi:hypothetical protein GCM10022297_01200 [Lactobacillus hamsteri]|uniref:hypothetical protein n=1 Tax=Lactobacillus hamsteri TaxID=96565 RepID=UPI000AE4A2B1|nr:hypothetical protein [Lactobacillus hamsteri]